MPTLSELIAERGSANTTALSSFLNWMQDPRRTQQAQGIGKAIQSALEGITQKDTEIQALQKKAFADPKNPLRVTDPEALAQLGDMMLSGPLSFAPAGLTVWHGSPHKFNKFDASKIGTGEGAQAYGHGLYVAESPDVARGYRERLSGSSKNKFILGGQEFSLIGGSPEWQNFHKLAKQEGFSDQSALLAYHKLREFKGDLAAAGGDLRWMENGTKVHDDAANLLLKTQYKPEGGSLYKIDLPDEQIGKMLDWDKPMKDQGEVLSKVRSLVPEDMLSTFDANVKSGISGANAYRNYVPSMSYAIREPNATNYVKSNAASFEEALAQVGGDASRVRQLHNYDAAKVAEKLRQTGIPGIRYLDQGSRGAGQGTSNFVIFPGNESLLKIIERN